jgi:hypothetical protein
VIRNAYNNHPAGERTGQAAASSRTVRSALRAVHSGFDTFDLKKEAADPAAVARRRQVAEADW